MFRHASATETSNSGTAADATALPNPSKITSDSFCHQFFNLAKQNCKNIFSI